MLDTAIRYFLVIGDYLPEEASLLQGFSNSLFSVSNLIRIISLLPSDIVDRTDIGRQTHIARKISGQFPVNLIPISSNALRNFKLPESSIFNFIIFEKSENAISNTKLDEIFPVMPGKIIASEVELEEINDLYINKELVRIANSIENESEKADLVELLKQWTQPEEKKMEYKVSGHGTIMPNVVTLKSAGYENIIDRPFSGHSEDLDRYVEQIIKTAKSIIENRNSYAGVPYSSVYPANPSLNLYCPYVRRSFFDDSFDWLNDPNITRDIRIVKNIIKNQKGYSYTPSNADQRRILLSIDENGEPRTHPLFAIRAYETNFGNDAISVLSASDFSATLRLPNSLNRTIGKVSQFTSRFRSEITDARGQQKQARLFKEAQEKIQQSIPSKIIEFIKDTNGGIRIISDAHLEWLYLDGYPLILQKTCSRIPVTPGNLFFEQVSGRPVRHMDIAQANNILIIDALEENDKIKDIFEHAFSFFSKEWKNNVKIHFASVSSEQDLVDAINGFSGGIVIFDGHGVHRDGESAKLIVGSLEVDIWTLRGRITNMPPIVILSACDTHAADRNHETTASGFLTLGAISVVATILPVNAYRASLFIARLIYRISNYVKPFIGISGQSLKWSDVVSGAFQKQFIAEMILELIKSGKISQSDFEPIHLEASHFVDSMQELPMTEFEKILQKNNVSDNDINTTKNIVLANTDSIAYLHIGRPETIVLDTEEGIREKFQAMQNSDKSV